MNVSLTPKLERFVRRKVASGLYNNASEVIREALRLLVERESGVAPAPPSQGPTKDDVRAKLAALERTLKERGVVSLALFGSVLHGAGPRSDIDVLIDVDPNGPFSLVDLVSVKNLLEERFGREVDVVLREGLDPAIRDSVLRDSERVF